MTFPPLRGVVPPVCTPLTPDFEVDTDSLRQLVEFLVESGVSGVFVLGSTGEAAYLPDRHRQRVLEVTVSTVSGKVPVLAGVIDMTTPRVLDHVRTAERSGVDGVVATAPFYTRTHPREMGRHFREIAAVTELPLYAYDIPTSTQSKLDSDMLLGLAEEGMLRGVKDSSGDDAALRGLVLAGRDRWFDVLTGSELTVDSALSMGADGVVPGLGNVDPHGYVRLYQHCRSGRYEAARTEQERLFHLFDIVHVGDPGRIGRSSSALGAFKAALQLRGVIDCPLTAPPQLPLTEDEIRQVKDHLVRASLL